MSGAIVPTTFRQHLGMVVRRALKSFGWTRDMLIGTGLAVFTVVLQAHWGLIAAQDWQEHWRLWILSVAIPFAAVVIPHFIWRLAEAPWRVHQEMEAEHIRLRDAILHDLTATQNQNALLTQRIDQQTWPDDRPQISFERWGSVEQGGLMRPQTGFYLANYGPNVAVEITVEEFVVGGAKWISKNVASIEGRQKGFALVWKENVAPTENKWSLDDCLRLAALSKYGEGTYSPDFEIAVHVKYRDFNNNWYRTTSQMKFIRSQGRIEFGPPTQQKLGSS